MGAMPAVCLPVVWGPTPAGQEKEEGPAEAAPEEEGKAADDAGPQAGYTNQHRRRTQVIELDGYFRTRAELLHNFNLGQGTWTTARKMAFRLSHAARVLHQAWLVARRRTWATPTCAWRLEPTINISDQVRVVAQIDVFDNLIYGSTPDSLISASQPALRTNLAPTGILSNSQTTPGSNTFTSAIAPKRVWARWTARSARLRFGRMPCTWPRDVLQQGRLRGLRRRHHGGPDHGHHPGIRAPACPFWISALRLRLGHD